MSIAIACGCDEDAAWVFVAARGRALWSLLVDPDELVTPRQLHAWSPEFEISHPGAVPLAPHAPFAAFLADLEGWLGADGFFERFVIELADGVVLAAEREESVRLEARSFEVIAARMPRLHPPSSAGWSEILSRLADEAMTNKYLTIGCDRATVTVAVHGGAREFQRGEVRESLVLELQNA